MERGFSLNIVSTVFSHSTPTCVSKELAERCSGFVTTIVMQVSLIHLLFSWKLAEPAEGLVGLCSLCSWRAMRGVCFCHIKLFWFLKPGSIHALKFSIIRDLIAFLCLHSSSIVEKAD
ncbi:hypothetical protein CXB51_027760 [Gossypium anomalum]|uniref:Uncharacterized protein n=1 Tax=Gossypium anomalum TaxID=47600 RepID=A0A8J5Y9D2_9ROSI|nr:hypothetical protein CXB51_027760 [Gossypium anomalum]